MPRISAYRAWCEACGETFAVPVLSDFAYGEFIAFGRTGAVFGHLNALDCPAWNEIEAIFTDLALPKSTGNLFQSIVDDCIDPIDGQLLSITLGPTCPQCGANQVDYRDLPADRMGSIDVPEFRFTDSLL